MIPIVMMSSCSKDDSNFSDANQFAKDKKLIYSYLSSHRIQADSTPEGIFYKIDYAIDTLPQVAVNSNSKVTVNYTGYFIDDRIFDSANNVTFKLSEVIKGWVIGMALLKEGEKARLFIPSRYGYGNKGSSEIPANSVLIFDVELLKVEG